MDRYTLMTAAEASAVLGVKAGHVRKLAARGILPCCRFGRRVLVNRAAVAAYAVTRGRI